MTRFPHLLRIILLYCLPAICVAQEATFSIQLKPELTIQANYIPGEQDKPVIVIIHGFLATGNHPTIINIKDALSDSGYGVLVPTLSLGIDRRNRSLPCEAIHSHTMDDDTQEISRWLDWLKSKTSRPVILLGHSYGSLQMLVYLSQYPDSNIKAAIATSLIDLEHAIGQEKVKNQLIKAHNLIRNGNIGLQEFRISYCKKYISTASSFISYAKWNKQQILELLAGIKPDVFVIMGGNDQRMSVEWPFILEKNGINVSIINDANHFFSNEHEFELQDRILSILDGM